MERSDILNQVASGSLSADEATRLLRAPSAGTRAPDPALAGRWLRIRVTDLDSGRQKVSVSVPMLWVDVGLRLGAQYHPNIAGIDLHDLVQQLQAGTEGRIVEVESIEDGERVEIFVD